MIIAQAYIGRAAKLLVEVIIPDMPQLRFNLFSFAPQLHYATKEVVE